MLNQKPRWKGLFNFYHMIIGIAGPYSASTEEERSRNFEAMNVAAARVYEKGHIPFIGVNMALPIVKYAATDDYYEAVMFISLAVIEKCDAILIIGESKGVQREKDVLISKGLPVYYSLDEVP